jgi:hypothetical protein
MLENISSKMKYFFREDIKVKENSSLVMETHKKLDVDLPSQKTPLLTPLN